MQQKGVAALTNTELLQALIGSGTAGMPVTKIARKVEALLKVKGLDVTLADLLEIKGLGTVKAGQLIAGFELATRLRDKHLKQNLPVQTVASLHSDVRASRKQILLYAFFNGSGNLLSDDAVSLSMKDTAEQVIRKLFSEALSQSAASIHIAVGWKNQQLEPAMYELNLARQAYAMASMLSIRIRSFVLVGEVGEHSIKEDSYGK